MKRSYLCISAILMALVPACAGNQLLIDNPPPADVGNQKDLLDEIPEKYRDKLTKMLDENLRHPGNAELLYELGLLYQYSGKPDLTDRFYRSCLQAEPQHVACAVNLASLLKLRNRIQDAVEVLEELFSAGADDPRARTDLAVLLRRLGNGEESIQQSQHVLKNFGQLYGARLNLGTNYLDQKKYELALSIFSDLVAEFPNDSKAHFSLGFTYQELGAFVKARTEYELAVSNDTGAFEAYNNLGLLHMFKQEYGDAEKLFRKAIAANINFTPAYLNLGISLRNLKQFKAAAESYDKAVSLQPDLREASYNLAVLYDDYLDLPRRARLAWQQYLDQFEKVLDADQRKYARERIEKLGERLERQRLEAEPAKGATNPPVSEDAAEQIPGAASAEPSPNSPLPDSPGAPEGIGLDHESVRTPASGGAAERDTDGAGEGTEMPAPVTP